MKLQNIKCVISPPFGHYIKFLDWATPIRGTFTFEPRTGIIKNSLKTFRPDFSHKSWVNKMSLVNTGLKNKFPLNTNHIWSITAFNINDWDLLYYSISDDIIVELNLFCPNSNEICCYEPVIRKFAKTHQTIVKLPSNSFKESYKYFNYMKDNGVRIFHVGNTIKTNKGGLSGREIQKVSLPLIERIKSVDSDITIIGGGGIYSKKDVIKYKDVGTDIYSLSTIFITKPWNIYEVKKEIFSD